MAPHAQLGQFCSAVLKQANHDGAGCMHAQQDSRMSGCGSGRERHMLHACAGRGPQRRRRCSQASFGAWRMHAGQRNQRRMSRRDST